VVAAVRDDTPILAKMFCRCRRTVCSLTVNAAAISRLVFPGDDQPKHLDLALGEAARALGTRRRGQRLDASEV
jgi:hypothetical protein